MVADGGDEKRTQNVDDTGNGGPAHVDTQTDTTNETSETELRPREQYDANGDLIVGTTGRRALRITFTRFINRIVK